MNCSFKCAQPEGDYGLCLILFPPTQKMAFKSIVICGTGQYVQSGELYTTYLNKSGIPRKSWNDDINIRFEMWIIQGQLPSFSSSVSPLLFSHGRNPQNVPLSKAMVIICPPATTTPFFRTYLNSREQLLKPCKGIIAQELTSDMFLKIALINPIIGNLPVRIPPGVTGIEERLGRLAFAQRLSLIWVPGACVFSLLGNTGDKLPSDFPFDS